EQCGSALTACPCGGDARPDEAWGVSVWRDFLAILPWQRFAQGLEFKACRGALRPTEPVRARLGNRSTALTNLQPVCGAVRFCAWRCPATVERPRTQPCNPIAVPNFASFSPTAS